MPSNSAPAGQLTTDGRVIQFFLGRELRIDEFRSGDAAEVKAKGVRKQRTDPQVAKALLKLLLENRFPQIWVPSSENRDLRQLFWHQHRLVVSGLADGGRHKRRIRDAKISHVVLNVPSVYKFAGQA